MRPYFVSGGSCTESDILPQADINLADNDKLENEQMKFRDAELSSVHTL